MILSGRRVHIAGSAAVASMPEIVAYARDLVGAVVRELVGKGAAPVVMVGREPGQDDGQPPERPIVFDWTVLAEVAQLDEADALDSANLPAVTAVLTSKTDEHSDLETRPVAALPTATCLCRT